MTLDRMRVQTQKKERKRKQNQKVNAVVQGFYSDRWPYAFMAIDMNGVVLTLQALGCCVTSCSDYNLIYSEPWIISLLYSAAKSSPRSPTKNDTMRHKEIHLYDDTVSGDAGEEDEGEVKE